MYNSNEYRCLSKVIDQVKIKMNGCFFYGKVPYGFCLNIRKRFFVEVSFKNQMKEHKVLWKLYFSFLNLPFKRSASFYMTITGNLELFLTQYFFKKNWSTVFSWKYYNLQSTNFIQNWSHESQCLRQTNYGVPTSPITKNFSLLLIA